MTINMSSGAAVFFGIEKFTFSESVYFVDVTVTTVGFGDSSDSPETLSNISCPAYESGTRACYALCDYRYHGPSL
jgi:hypothetical protein